MGNNIKNSISCAGCEGCQHRLTVVNQWCYMFRDKPEKVPCGQHDKFRLHREITGRMLKKHPEMFLAFVADALMERNAL